MKAGEYVRQDTRSLYVGWKEHKVYIVVMSLILFYSLLLVSSTATSQHWHDRYIQTTRVPTLHFQPSLPRLPIPRLEDTCSRYLDALTPVTTDEQLSGTRSVVAKFLREGGEGEGTFSMIMYWYV